MIRHKVCMLGAFAVGKTSLVRRFVNSIFDDRYQTTIGVQIEKRTVEYPENPVDLMIWDIAGDDEFFQVPRSFIGGAVGYLLVVDATRRSSGEIAGDLDARAREELGDVPSLLLINKCDLTDEVDLPGDWSLVGYDSSSVLRTSALTGEGVAGAFDELTRRIEFGFGRTR
ncbi:MAG: Rab family GTPase [Planctomycetota bacterium]